MCLSLVSFFHPTKPCHKRAACLRFCRHCFCPTCSYYTTNSILPGQTYGTYTVTIRSPILECTNFMYKTQMYTLCIYEYPTTQCTLRSGLIGHVPVWMQFPDHLLQVRSNHMMTCGNFFLFRWVCVIGDPAPRIDHAALKIVAVLGEIVFGVG